MLDLVQAVPEAFDPEAFDQYFILTVKHWPQGYKTCFMLNLSMKFQLLIKTTRLKNK